MEISPLIQALVLAAADWIVNSFLSIAGSEPIEGRLIGRTPNSRVERVGASRPVLINRRQITLIRSWVDHQACARSQPCRALVP